MIHGEHKASERSVWTRDRMHWTRQSKLKFIVLIVFLYAFFATMIGVSHGGEPALLNLGRRDVVTMLLALLIIPYVALWIVSPARRPDEEYYGLYAGFAVGMIGAGMLNGSRVGFFIAIAVMVQIFGIVLPYSRTGGAVADKEAKESEDDHASGDSTQTSA